jgi:putative transposase
MCPPPLPKDRRAIFGLNVRRKVRGNGVLVCGIQYRCDQLDQLFLRRPDDEHNVKVRINPENIGTVDVLIDGEWFPARAVGGGFDGIRMDLWIAKIRAIRQTNHDKSLLKRHVVLEALADIRAMNNDPYLLLDMTPFGCTAKQINHAEKSVFLGLEAEALSSAEMEKHFIATSFEVSPALPEATVPETCEPEPQPDCPIVDDDAIIETSGLVFRGASRNG